jgi:hypothetical protein
MQALPLRLVAPYEEDLTLEGATTSCRNRTTRVTKVTNLPNSPRVTRMNKKSNRLHAGETTNKSRGPKAEATMWEAKATTEISMKCPQLI